MRFFLKPLKVFTFPKLHKSRDFYFSNAVESTPVYFNDHLYLVLFERPVSDTSHGTAAVIYDFFTKKEVYRYPWAQGLGCAIVAQNHLYIFGTTDWNTKNCIKMVSLDEKFHPNELQTVWEAKQDQKIFNSSVAPCPDGYIMAYETHEPKVHNFSIRFAQSKDLYTWESIGTIFHPDIYAACPTIRYYNGYYYIFYLRSVGKYYIEYLARTNDFMHFEEFTGNGQYSSDIQVLSSVNFPYEGINNSDIDCIEYNGITLFVYADGDQQTWANLRTAIYLGTLGQFFEEFWPS